MKKIRIAHCVCGLDGGVGNVILNYFDHMPLEDYEVHILSNDISSELYTKHYEERGFKIIQIPRVGRHPFRSLKTIRNIMKENGYDIVHCHMTLTNIFPLWSAKRAGIKVRVSHIHHVIDPKKSLKDRVLTFVNRKFSRSLATDLMACGKEAGRSVFGEKAAFSVLNNALELEKYRCDEQVRQAERRKLDVENKFVIGHIGRFTNQKNHDFLIDVFGDIRKKNPDAVLLLIGEGELMDDIKEKVRKMDLKDHVIFTGAIDDVPAKLQAMDAFVLPSFSEGLGIVAVEAQLSGLPCVLSTKVPEEACFSKEVTFLLLNAPVSEWCDAVISCKGVRSEGVEELLRENNYDINIEAEKLDHIYKSRI